MTDDHDSPFRNEEEEPKSEGEGDRKRVFERVLPEILKRVIERAVETGASRLAEGPENLRQFVGDLKLPKEVLHYLYTQMDDTKSGLYRVVAKEIRDVFERVQLADEITKVLTKFSFEIKTEIRFIPNSAAVTSSSSSSSGSGSSGADDDEERDDEGSGGAGSLPKPEVSTQVSVKDRSKDARRDRRRREDT
jgi:hypothetical protein